MSGTIAIRSVPAFSVWEKMGCSLLLIRFQPVFSSELGFPPGFYGITDLDRQADGTKLVGDTD